MQQRGKGKCGDEGRLVRGRGLVEALGLHLGTESSDDGHEARHLALFDGI